jgi:hypothetical protein
MIHLSSPSGHLLSFPGRASRRSRPIVMNLPQPMTNELLAIGLPYSKLKSGRQAGMSKVAINGLGRIGRAALKILLSLMSERPRATCQRIIQEPAR